MSTSLQSSTLQSDTFSNGFYPVPESLPVLPEWKLSPVKHSRGTRHTTTQPMDSGTTSKLDQSGDFNSDGSFSTTLNALTGSASGTAVAYVQTAMDSVFNSVLGQANIGVRNLQAAVSDDLKTVYVSGQLNNGNKVTLVVGTTVALDYVATGGLDLGSVTKVDFLKGLGLSSIELVVSSGDVAFDNDDGESVDFSRGLHLIGTIDLKSSSNQVFKFINQYAHIDSLEAQVDLAPEDGLALSGTINTNLQLFPIVVSGIINTDIGGGFKIIEKSASIDWSIGKDLEPAAGMSNTLEVRGYDPTQKGEPALTLTGGYSFEPESVTLFGALDTGGLSGWSNPFGFQGAQIRRLGFQVGATYLPPFIDNIGVIAGLKWDQYDVDFAGSLDVNDPEKLGFALTVNQDINVVTMMAQMQAMMLGPAAPAAFKLIDLSKDLFKYIPLTVRSFDSNGDHQPDPLVSFVPFATEIAGFKLDEGMGINARVNLAGEVGELALNAKAGFTELSGSLRLSNLKLGDNWLVISGTQPGSDLTASFDISPAGVYAYGDGKIALFGQTLTEAHFSISPGHIAVTNTVLPLIPLLVTLNIDSFDVNFNKISASGTTHLNILGYNMAGLSFDMSRQRIHIAGNFDLGPLDINGSMDWNTSQQTLDISGSMSINGVTIGSARVNYDHGALNINGSVGVKIPNIGDIDANVTGTFTSNNFALSIGADLGALGHPKISIPASEFNLDNLATKLYNKVASDIGQVPDYIASSIKDGWTDVVHAGNYIFEDVNKLNSQISNAINTISKGLNNLFAPAGEKNGTFIGGVGGDNLNGNGGNDKLMGKEGNDFLDAHQGNDLVDGGTGNDTVYGGSNEDTVYGGDGDDRCDGGAGYDLLYGGLGNDLIYGDSPGPGGGHDTIYAGEGNDTVYGSGEADSIYGNGGNDYLAGGFPGDNDGAIDTLVGGTGDDIYYQDTESAANLVVENPDEGTDQVSTNINGYVLPANVENLYLNGREALSVSGNELNNVLSSNAAADTLSGGAGDDTYFINGGGVHFNWFALNTNRTDSGYYVDGVSNIRNGDMRGTFYLNGNDLSWELGGRSDYVFVRAYSNLVIPDVPGTDKYILNLRTLSDDGVEVWVDAGGGYTSVISNRTFHNLYDDRGYIEVPDNSIIPIKVEYFEGTGKDNRLDVQWGQGSGSYNYASIPQSSLAAMGVVVQEQANSGFDTINSPYSYTLPNDVEQLNLTGTSPVSGAGNALDNILNGQSNTATNTLAGRAGNDNYYVGSNDTVREDANAGTDTIYSFGNYTLPANVENLTLTGTSAVNGTGNTQDNILTGNSAANILAGGAGNDSYTVDSLDTVNENANAGTDTVYSSGSYTLPANVENLVLTGGDFVNATGNVLDNVLTGNSAANSLSGGMGNDSYYVDISDTVSEADNAGTDTLYSSVSYTLPANVENLILTGGDAANARGNALNNLLIGNAAANSLIGGEGADTLKGGLGDDSYSVDSLDTVNEDANAGTDTVYTSVSYTLPANVENLILTDSDAVNATGNTLANVLTGNAVANSLTGGEGADTLTGGLGDDSYSVDSLDTVNEDANAGTDTVYSSVSYTLPANVENLTLGGGTPNVRGTGNGLDNVFKIGTAGSNLTLVGGAGNDSYYIDNRVTTVSEDTNAGIDTIYGFGSSFGSSALPANVENLTLMGTGNNSARGNTLDNVLTGNPDANTLSGDLGNDSYYVDGLDTVIENANAGTDTIYTSVNYTLPANVENLVLTGSDAVNATGNTLANVLTGNAATNSLTGGDGADTLKGGLGDDSYSVDSLDTVNEDANAGTDTIYTSVSYTLPANFENLTLTGTSSVNGTGNALDNILTGNSAANSLMGGDGADTLKGGLGNDSYSVDSLDTVNEDANAGTDTVYTSVNYTLPANVENLILTGSDAVNATGNTLANVLTGNSAANSLTGGDGADTLKGGLGDDSYSVDNLDTVNEDANAGTDTLYSSVSYTLPVNVENLTLTGTSSVNGTGNALDNILTGNSAANTLVGGIGNDSYYVDSLDTVNEDANAGTDTVYTSVSYTLPANVENLILTGSDAVNATGNTLANVLTGNVAANSLTGGDGADTLKGGLGDDSYTVDSLDTVNEDANAGTDTVYSSGSYTLPVNVENLTLTGTSSVNGTGNALDNILTGNSAANTLVGGIGNDSYTVDSLDTVNEDANAGTDTIYSSINYTLPANVENLVLTGSDAVNATGNTLANVLTGNSAANSLTGGEGADTLKGGLGDDSYSVDSLDTVIEDANAGTDTIYTSVSYVLPLNVENLVLTGTDAINATGNTLGNALTGNSAANSLSGGDGADTLIGGLGNDSYTVDSLDTVIEDANAGTDTIYTSVSYTLPANVENLTIGGTPGIRGTGNSLDNVFNLGTAGSSLTLVGGAGNDSYYVDSRVSLITEDANGGIDTLYGFGPTFGSSALPANVENLTLMGSGSNSGLGNDLANVLTGNPGNNTLDGGKGADTLTGGAGQDTFRLSSSDISSVRTITDFSVVDDTLQLSKTVFSKFTVTGAISSGSLVVGSSPLDSNDYLIYNPTTGALLYDTDGNGATASVQIAVLPTGLALTNQDFVII